VDDGGRDPADHRGGDLPGQALDDFSLSDPFVWLATGVLVVLVATTLVGARHLGRSPRQPSPKG
jgi:hypothetical protein